MSEIPKNHPRYLSLKERHEMTEAMHKKIIAEAGLIAHGRGEAFDYILGEKTPDYALIQEKTAVATLLLAQYPVISINGNVAVLCPKELVQLARKVKAKLEVNLFYRTTKREKTVAEVLKKAGAKEVLGVNLKHPQIIPEISHKRRIVDPEGIYKADVVLVPLEDGDRTMALRKIGKTVIGVDLNPLSRTAVWCNITIVNHIRRAANEMLEFADKMVNLSRDSLVEITKTYDNNKMLQESVKFMANRLLNLSKEQIKEG